MGKTGSKYNHSRWFGKNHRRIICVGLSGSGKTTVKDYFLSQYASAGKSLPEIGCYKFSVEKYTLVFYDLKGDEQSKFFWRHHYEGSQGVIFVIDLSDAQTFDLAKQVLNELMSDQFLKTLPFAILCNKSDLAQKCSKENLKIMLDINDNNLYEIFITCAIKGKGVIESIKWLLKEMNSIR